jgi:alpha-maltose-1-phosphate synthase
VKIALLSREYPPEVYGGAGVHVEYLARELARHVSLGVYCFGAARQAPEVQASYKSWGALDGSPPELAALRTLSIDLLMAKDVAGSSLVHSHTWYANFAGHLAKLMYGIPHVMTSHSLEPLRPWKAEQLGGGYAISSFCERTAIEAADAVIAVSSGMKRDILKAYPAVDPARVHIVYNGIDLDEYQRDPESNVLARLGIDAEQPYAVFVGRVTRQKGIVHLLEAVRHLDKNVRLVLCAGEADTPDLKQEVEALVQRIEAERGGLIWIQKMMPRPELIQVLSHARVFVCPSIYEPFGIVNLEAMACGAPVVASAVGGIPEIVEDGKTGYLVSFEPDGSPMGGPRDRESFARALALRINELCENPVLARQMGDAGRQRVEDHFAWSTVARQTATLYERLCGRKA